MQLLSFLSVTMVKWKTMHEGPPEGKGARVEMCGVLRRAAGTNQDTQSAP